MGSIHKQLQRRQCLTKGALSLPAAAALLTLHPLLVSAANAANYGIKGQRAPRLEVPHWIDGTGRSVAFDTAAAEGRWVYMSFFQNWCPGSHEYGFPALQKVHSAFADDPRVTLLAIQTAFEGFAINTPDRLRELQLRYELPIMMGHDAGSSRGQAHPLTMRQYRASGTPWVVVINPEGTVVYNDIHIDAQRFIDYLQQRLA